jgi:hypothetical protein
MLLGHTLKDLLTISTFIKRFTMFVHIAFDLLALLIKLDILAQ